MSCISNDYPLYAALLAVRMVVFSRGVLASRRALLLMLMASANCVPIRMLKLVC